MYEKIKINIPRWYKQGLWTEAMVQNAAKKGVITEDEASAILCKEE